MALGSLRSAYIYRINCMSIKSPPGAQVYNVTSSKNTPDWLKGKATGSLKKDEDFRQASLSMLSM